MFRPYWHLHLMLGTKLLCNNLFMNKTGNVHINTEVRLCQHCCNGKALSITQPECVFLALGIQHAMHMGHIAICGLPHSTIFSHIIL